MAECEVEGPLWVVLGRSRGLCVRSWVALGASAGGLGSLLGPLWAVLDSSWGLCGRSWVALGASAGDLGPLLGLCRRSWAALGAFVGDLGPLLGPLLAVVGRLGPKSGPNPSGKAIWQADLGREVAQTRAGRQSRGRKNGGAGAVPKIDCFGRRALLRICSLDFSFP